MNALHLSSEEFRSLAQRLTSLCADFLGELDRLPTFPRVSGSQTQALFAQPLPLEGMKAAALDALPQLMQFARPPSPRFFGYVLGSGEPVAALGDLLASVLNQNVTAWRSSPCAVAVEQQVLRWIAEALGCESFTGSFCGGGSAANLMALAMARESKVPANEAGAQPGVVYASTEIHMSTPKAVALLGLGRRDCLKLVAVDEQFRIDLAALQMAIEQDVAAGRNGIAIVASAGTVNTGAIDPLPQIAALCKQYDLWLHVDGAYGGLAALAAPDRFAGLAQADSISLDPHKWLYQPLDCALLLYKDRAIARAAFSHTGDYAKSLDSDPIEGFMFFDESLELSRRFRALKLWLSLRYHGLQAFRAAIEADLDHAGQLAARIRASADLELLAAVPLSAVCFRYRGDCGHLSLNEFNSAVLRRVIRRGRVYLSNASVRGHFALRVCFVNHRTTDADVAEIVAEVLAAAQEIRRED